MTDWRGLLEKYINVVGEVEGVDFLYQTDWTKEEWEALRSLDANNPPQRNEPLPEWTGG